MDQNQHSGHQKASDQIQCPQQTEHSLEMTSLIKKQQKDLKFEEKKLLPKSFKNSTRKQSQQTTNMSQSMELKQQLLNLCKNQLDAVIDTKVNIFEICFMRNNQNIQQRKKYDIFKQNTLLNYIDNFLAKLKIRNANVVLRFYAFCKEQQLFYRFLQHLYYSNDFTVINVIFQYTFYIWQLFYPCFNNSRIDTEEQNDVLDRISLKIYEDQVRIRKAISQQGIDQTQLYVLISQLSHIVGSLMTKKLSYRFNTKNGKKRLQNEQLSKEILQYQSKQQKRRKTCQKQEQNS